MSDRAYDLIVYHAGCPDGWCAAWVAERNGSPGAELVPASYGDDPPPCDGKRVLVADFSWPPDVLVRVLGRAARLTVLDHHRSSHTGLEDLARDPGPGGDRLTVVSDLSKSGCRLAWEHCRPGEDPPEIVRYVEDRDLWRWELRRSREVNAALASYLFDLGEWDVLAERVEDAPRRKWLEGEGVAILRYQAREVERHVAGAATAVLGGVAVPACNATTLVSEVTGALAAGVPFAATWRDRGGERLWSLRSAEGGADVAAVAESLGGGGHPRSSGFTEPLPAGNVHPVARAAGGRASDAVQEL